MVIVPLMAEGEVLGTLYIGRMGSDEAHYSHIEFELTKLFAGQASIALENAETHGAIKVRAEHDALTGLRNHGSFQRELAGSSRSATRVCASGSWKRFIRSSARVKGSGSPAAPPAA